MKGVGDGIVSGSGISREDGGFIRKGSFDEGDDLADSFMGMASPVTKPSAPLLKPLSKSNSNGVTQMSCSLAEQKQLAQ